MNAKTNLAHPHPLITAIAATLSTVIAIGILAAVVGLLQSRGTPMAQLAAAERACAGLAYVSEREACTREWLAASRSNRVARR
jgi:hypothetical protein